MGLGMGAVQNTLELWHQGMFANSESIVEMGSQEIHVKAEDFKELITMAGASNYRREDFVNLENWPNQPRCPAKSFYSLLGFKEYRCVDLGGELEAIPHDYNLPFEDTSLYSKFDVVTDHGSCEHAFNIGEAYRTMHRLCKPGGLIIIAQNIWGGNGYYHYDRSFFDGLAAANKYQILFGSYLIATKEKTLNGTPYAFHVPMNKELLKTIDITKVEGIGVYGVLKKQVDADFEYPYQGGFLSEKQGHFGFNRLFYRDPPSYSYIPTDINSIRTPVLVKTIIERAKKKLRVKFPF